MEDVAIRTTAGGATRRLQVFSIWRAWRYIAPIGIVLGLGAYLGGTIGGEIGAITKASQIGSVASIGIGFFINLAQGAFGSVGFALAQSEGMGYSAQFCGYAGVAVATMVVYSIAICFVMIHSESEYEKYESTEK